MIEGHVRQVYFQIKRTFTHCAKFPAMATVVTTDVKLSRCNDQPWGFRLSGGVDFTFPLTVVRVRYS